MMHRLTALPILVAIAALACSATDTEPGPVVESNIRETAEIRIDSSGVRTLVVTLTLENLEAADRPILWGEDCAGNGPLDVRMFRGTTLVWESARFAPLNGCPVRAIQSAISANGSASFGWQLPIETILGDSLAPGEYSFTVQPTLASPVLSEQVSAGALAVADPIAVPPGTNLNGTWAGSSGGLTVSLALTWSADSVRGSGTYAASGASSLPCVVPSLHGTGTVSFAARRTKDVVAGGLTFDVGYVPPYGGRLRSADRFDGTIMAVDTPGCALTLTRAK